MKLQDLQEGLAARTKAHRRKRRMKRNVGAYEDIIQEVAKLLIPIIEDDEAHIYRQIRDDLGPNEDMPHTVEEHLATVSEFFIVEDFEQKLTAALMELWDKKWNSN